MNICICVTESLCGTPETNIALQIKYITIKLKYFKK